MLENYPIRLKKLVLDENKIRSSLVEAINTSMSWNDDEEADETDIKYVERESTNQTQDKPVGVKIHKIQSQSMYVDDDDEEEEEDDDENGNTTSFKDTGTIPANEDYKEFAKAIEEGLHIGGEEGESSDFHETATDTMKMINTSSEDSDEETTLQEVKVTSPSKGNVVVVTSKPADPNRRFSLTPASNSRPASASSQQPSKGVISVQGSHAGTVKPIPVIVSRPGSGNRNSRPGSASHSGHLGSSTNINRPGSATVIQSRPISAKHDGRPISAK